MQSRKAGAHLALGNGGAGGRARVGVVAEAESAKPEHAAGARAIELRRPLEVSEASVRRCM